MNVVSCWILFIIIPLRNEFGGGYIVFSLSICLSPYINPSVCRWHGFQSMIKSQISYAFLLWLWAEVYLYSVMSLLKWLPGSHIEFLGFQTHTLVWLWISNPSFTGITLACMERSLLIFSDVTFKMAIWQPYWIFCYLDSVGGMVSSA